MITKKPLTVNGLDQRIAELRSLLDRTTARLIELDADVTRQLLEVSSSLRGRTLTEWADASRRHADLWRGQFALEGALSRVAEARGRRRFLPQAELQRVDGLLEGAAADMPGSNEGSRLRLTEPSVPVVRMTIEGAIRHMSTDYEFVADLVDRVADVWGATSERLQELARQLAALEEHSDASGARLPNEFGAVRQAIADAIVEARDDPLEYDPRATEAVEGRVQRISLALEEAMVEHGKRAADLAAAAGAVRDGLEAVAALRDQLDHWSEKVVVPESTRSQVDRLAGQLDEAAQESERLHRLGSPVGGGALRRRAESVLGDVRGLAAAEGSRLAVRSELRGILDAYRAKAQALGQAEDLVLEGLFVQAQEALYSAPCDLEAARQLVEEYRRAVWPSRAERS
ncbi:MAG TPA: hypothetical protein VIX84_20965 [Acidimicrobiales bacterium]